MFLHPLQIHKKVTWESLNFAILAKRSDRYASPRCLVVVLFGSTRSVNHFELIRFLTTQISVLECCARARGKCRTDEVYKSYTLMDSFINRFSNFTHWLPDGENDRRSLRGESLLEALLTQTSVSHENRQTKLGPVQRFEADATWKSITFHR